MTTRCHIELRLLDGGVVNLQAEILGTYLREPATLRPGDALRLLEEWLQPHDCEPIDVVVMGDGGALAWNTQSSNFALYWVASILGHAIEQTQAADPTSVDESRARRQVSGFAAKAPDDESLTEEPAANSPTADEDVA